MAEDQARMRAFIDTVPLVHLDPSQLVVTSTDPEVRGWGVAGNVGGFVWVQDFTLGETDFELREDIDAIRSRPPRTGVAVELGDMAAGTFAVSAYDTWTGAWLEPITVDCEASTACSIELPTFTHDLALKLDRV